MSMKKNNKTIKKTNTNDLNMYNVSYKNTRVERIK